MTEDEMRTAFKNRIWLLIKSEAFGEMRASDIIGLLAMVQMEMFACLSPAKEEPTEDWRRSL